MYVAITEENGKRLSAFPDETYFTVKCDGQTVMDVSYWKKDARREQYVLNAFWHHLKRIKNEFVLGDDCYEKLLQQSTSVVFQVQNRDQTTVKRRKNQIFIIMLFNV